MRICLWANASFEKSYASYHLIKEILLAMLNSEHEVWLIQPQYADGNLPEELSSYSNLHVVNVPNSISPKTNFIKRYINLLLFYKNSAAELKKTPRIDSVFLQSTSAAFLPIRYIKKYKIPVLFNVQDIFPKDALVTGMLTEKHPAYIFGRLLQRYAYKKADRVVTISEDLKKTIISEGRKDVDVVYNWSYRNEPYDITDCDNHFLNTYKIKREDGFRVVYAGNIGKMMDAETMIQTAVRLKEYKDIKFYIIGTGSNVKYLTKRADEEKLTTSMFFFDSQPMEYAPDNYCMADVNINPVPKGVMFTCMPSKTNTCLLSQKPTVVSMDLESDMAQKLSKVDKWTVVAPGDAKAMAEGILKYYNETDWKSGECLKSKNSAEFIAKLGPVENAYEYVRILEEEAKQ